MSGRKPGGGWADFAAAILGIAGLLNALQGLSAMFKREYFAEAQMLYEDLGVWAVVWLVVGVAQLGTASLLIGREPSGRVLGIVFAAGSIVVSFLSMNAAPVWHLSVLALDVLIVYGLTTHPEAFEGREGPTEDWMHPVERPVVTPPPPR